MSSKGWIFVFRPNDPNVKLYAEAKIGKSEFLSGNLLI